MHIVTGEKMQEMDRCTMNEIGINGPMLMENAGRAVAGKISDGLKKEDRIAVMIGTGNNGGDGFVIARILADAGFGVEAWLIPPKEKIKGDALTHLRIFERAGFEVMSYAGNEKTFSDSLGRYTHIVDALLGTGVAGAPRSPYQEVIDKLNAAGAEVISVDVPSGTPVNGGDIEGNPIEADRTLTLQCPKPSALIYPAADYYGTWEAVDIGIPKRVIEENAPSCRLWEEANVADTLPQRKASSHKGSHGKGLVIGGSQNLTGAPVMAARSALRAGAGLLTAAVPDIIHPIVAAQITEATYMPAPSAEGGFAGELDIGDAFDGGAVGPGLGRTDGARRIVERTLEKKDLPLVIDADGLYFLNENPSTLRERQAPTVLTPHPGEMARLCLTSVGEVQANRFAISRRYAVENGVYLVLKGPHTIVTTPQGRQYVNPTGNAALAKGGTGDVLTGLILAFLMQHDDPQAGVSNAVYMHGLAADQLVSDGHSPLDVLATDVIDALPGVLRLFLS